jgi:hypothetical protein
MCRVGTPPFPSVSLRTVVLKIVHIVFKFLSSFCFIDEPLSFCSNFIGFNFNVEKSFDVSYNRK